MPAANDLVYDLVSIQYHAPKGAQAHEQFLRDASQFDGARRFIEQVRDEDAGRAERCHMLVKQLTLRGIGSAPSSSGEGLAGGYGADIGEAQVAQAS
jgi:hypothetical protein